MMTANNENQANFLVTEDGDCYFAKLNISGKTVLKTTKEIDGVVKEDEFKVDDFTKTYSKCYVLDIDSSTLDSCEEQLLEEREFLERNSGTWLIAAAPLSQMGHLWPDYRAEIDDFYIYNGERNYVKFKELTGDDSDWFESSHEQVGEWFLTDSGFHCLQSPDYYDNDTGRSIKIRELQAGYRTTDGKNDWLYRAYGRGELRPIYLRYPLQIITNQRISSLVLPLPTDGKELGFFAYTLGEDVSEGGPELKRLKPHRTYRMMKDTAEKLQLIQFENMDPEGRDEGFPQNVLIYPIGSKTNETSYASQQGYVLQGASWQVCPVLRVGLI